MGASIAGIVSAMALRRVWGIRARHFGRRLATMQTEVAEEDGENSMQMF